MKKNRNKKAKVTDVKAAAAHDEQPKVVIENATTVATVPNAAKVAPTPTLPAKTMSAIKSGAGFHKLAGSPSKAAVIAVFGKTGYAYSWITRGEKLGVPTEQLCEKFRAEAESVKVAWEKATTKATK
jgi:hypothetical protein